MINPPGAYHNGGGLMKTLHRRYVSLMSVLGWFSLKLLKNDCQRRVSENMYVN